MAITFDKMAYFDRLKTAGVEELLARAMAEGLDQALKEEVATKGDLDLLGLRLEGRINLLGARMGKLEWMAGFNLTLTIGVLAKLMFFTH